MSSLPSPHPHSHGHSLSQPLNDAADDREPERTIAALFALQEFEPIMPSVLSFLSVVELLYVEAVNRNWHSWCGLVRQSHTRKLHLGQFWSRLGVLDTKYFTKLASTFHSIKDLNVAYCHFMKGDCFLSLLESIPNYAQLERINLFYCYQLTDEHIQQLVTKTPKLRELNLGRVSNITDRGLAALASLQELRSLNVIQNPNISEDTLMLLDDGKKFPALQIFNVVNCSRYTPEMLDEVKATRPHLKVIGPLEVFTVDKSGKKLRRDVQDT